MFFSLIEKLVSFKIIVDLYHVQMFQRANYFLHIFLLLIYMYIIYDFTILCVYVYIYLIV